MKSLALCFLAVALVSPMASAETSLVYGIMDWNKPCLADAAKWNTRKGWKAFAVSGLFTNPARGDNFPYQECGLAWEAVNKATAERVALKRCNEGLRIGGGVGKAVCDIKASEK